MSEQSKDQRIQELEATIELKNAAFGGVLLDHIRVRDERDSLKALAQELVNVLDSTGCSSQDIDTMFAHAAELGIKPT